MQLINNCSTEVPWQVYIDWMDCLHFLYHMSVAASHIYREGNGVADAFANLGVTTENLEWWPSFPSFYLSLIYDDLNRIVRFRFV